MVGKGSSSLLSSSISEMTEWIKNCDALHKLTSLAMTTKCFFFNLFLFRLRVSKLRLISTFVLFTVL